jgi:hypothetical protein
MVQIRICKNCQEGDHDNCQKGHTTKGKFGGWICNCAQCRSKDVPPTPSPHHTATKLGEEVDKLHHELSDKDKEIKRLYKRVHKADYTIRKLKKELKESGCPYCRAY